MSEEISTDNISPSLLQRVDQICDRFERAWRKGDQPRIEDHLIDVEASEQVPLLRELLRVELEYRARAGETINLELYQKRFTQHAELVEVLVREAAPGGLCSTVVYSEKSTGTSTPASALAAGETGPYIPLASGDATAVPQVLGDYELLDRLGKGGMGVVYRARQRSANRIVALKVIRPERLEDLPPEQRQEWLRRFRAEGQAAARLDHENVVTVHEVGEADGQLFYSMRYVEGRSLADMLRDDGPMPDRRAAAYLEPVARALHHVHGHGILHRDLKPGNILVDANGRPLVADFGLAKWLSGEPNTIQTRGALGTPEYMAPEQARNAALAEPATDVYSLGATLYALLTGRPPFQAPDPVETMRQVIDKEPVPPRRLNPAIARDLETVCLKCLDKQPGKRYGSAEELACDLKSFLEGKPIKARPIGWAGRTLKWTRRRPGIAFLLAVIVILIAGGFAGIYSQYLDVVAEKNEVVHQKKIVDERLDFTRHTLMNTQLMRVGALYERYPDKGRELLEDVEACPVEFRDFAWGFYHGQCKRKRFRLELDGRSAVFSSVAFSPDSRIIATGGVDGRVTIWDSETGRPIESLPGHASSADCVVFSPDGKTLASADDKGTVILWNVATWKLRLTCGQLTKDVRFMAFSPDGLALATVIQHGTINLWDTATAELHATFEGDIDDIHDTSGYRYALAFTPNGKTLGFSHRTNLKYPNLQHQEEKSELKLWDVSSGECRIVDKDKAIWWGTFAFTPDGNTLLAGGCYPPAERKGQEGEILKLDLASGQETRTFVESSAFEPQAFSPDCKTLACFEPVHLSFFGERHEVSLWDVDKVQVRTTLELGKGSTGCWKVAFSHDGKSLASLCPFASGSQITLWNIERSQQCAVLADGGGWVSVSANGRMLASWGMDDGPVHLWDLSAAKAVAVLACHCGGLGAVAFSPDGITLATSGTDQAILLWDLDTKNVRATLKGNAEGGYCLAFSPDGRTLASGDATGNIKLWDTASGEEKSTLTGHTGNVRSVLYSHDGNTLISAGHDERINLWDLANEKTLATLEHRMAEGGIFRGNCLCLAPDGKTLVSGAFDGTVAFWDLSTNSLRTKLKLFDPVFSVACTPDGKTLAVAQGDIRFVDMATFQERARIEGGAISSVFTPDSNFLISGGTDGAIRIWDGRIDR